MQRVLNHIIRLSLVCLPGLSNIAAQEEFLTDRIYKSAIRTVQFHREGWDLTYPIIELNGTDRLELSFDELTDRVGNYYYTLEHCDADWLRSGIPPGEYMSGFPENPLNDYSLSFNTTTNYIHYKLILPNEETGMLISGNYILRIFEDYDRENTVLTKRFAVAEPLVSIEGRAARPSQDPYRNEGHQVTFEVNLGSVRVNDPYSEIRVVIQQNNRWNMAIQNLKPLFNRGNILDYSYMEDNIFKAGNEYRYFDTKSIRYQSQYIKAIEYQAPDYHVYLFPDRLRNGEPYFFHEDLNGRYYIDVQEGVKRETESDYVYVHFNLPCEVPLADGKLYVSGALNNWECNAQNRMEYNFGQKAYEAAILLKQGYYNYEYAFVRNGSVFPDATFIEGSFYETENDYVIYIYLRTTTSRYDRLIGYQFLNSAR